MAQFPCDSTAILLLKRYIISKFSNNYGIKNAMQHIETKTWSFQDFQCMYDWTVDTDIT